MEFPKKFDSKSVAYEDTELKAGKALDNFQFNWFPAQAREVLEQSISKINILEGTELRYKQLLYFGAQGHGTGILGEIFPKYVRITEGGSTRWYNTYIRCGEGSISFGVKDEVTDFFTLQEDMKKFVVSTLVLDYLDNDKKDRVTLHIRKEYFELLNSGFVVTRQADEKIKDDFQRLIDNFMDKKGYVFDPNSQGTMEKVGILHHTDSNSRQDQPIIDEDTRKRIQDNIDHLNQLKQSQYEEMIQEERNAIITEIERREASDPNYHRPGCISTNEKSRFRDSDFQNVYPNGFLDNDRFQDDIRRCFPHFP